MRNAGVRVVFGRGGLNYTQFQMLTIFHFVKMFTQKKKYTALSVRLPNIFLFKNTKNNTT